MRKADNLPPYCAVVKNSRSLNFLDTSGPARPVTGVFYLYLYQLNNSNLCYLLSIQKWTAAVPLHCYVCEQIVIKLRKAQSVTVATDSLQNVSDI